MPAVHLRLLGGFAATTEAGAPLDLPTRKTRALAAYLAMSEGHARSRDHLASMLWSDSEPASARNSLRQALFSLRRTLGPTLEVDSATVRFDRDYCRVDVEEFSALQRRRTIEALAQAMDLYRGDFLEGFEPCETAFDEWAEMQRATLRRQGTDVMAQVLSLQIAAGADEAAAETAARLIALEPLEEAAHRTLMRLHARRGRTGAALDQYRRCAALLARDLGVSPEAETTALYQQILADRAAPARGAGASLLPGRHGPTPSATILVVDDDPEMQQLLRVFLARAGYTVTVAADGLQALRCMAERGPFDLVLSDIMMPGMDGLQLLDEMGRRGIATPAILVTARGDQEAELTGLERGAADYVRKPIQIDVLLLRVRNALKRLATP